VCVRGILVKLKKYLLQIRQIKFLHPSFQCFYLHNILEIKWQGIPQSGYNDLGKNNWSSVASVDAYKIIENAELLNP